MSPQSAAAVLSPPVDTTIRILDFGSPVTCRPVTPRRHELVITQAPAFERAEPLRPLTLVQPGDRLVRLSTATPARQPGAVRLTLRGRAVLVLVALGLLILGFSISNQVSLAAPPAASASALAQTAAAAGQPGARSLFVQPGQTLWAIAEQLAPNADPRVTVQRIIAANHLANADVQAGEQLILPS